MTKVMIRNVSILVVLIISIFMSKFAYAGEKNASDALREVLDQHWQAQLEANPTFATSIGVRDFDSKLSDLSLESYERNAALSLDLSEKLKSIDVDQLSEEDRLNRDLLLLELENEVAAAKHGGRYMLLTNRGGPHLTLTSMVGRLPFFTLADYQSYVDRLGQIESYLKSATSRMQVGLEKGWVQPCEPMQGYEKSISAHVVDDPSESRFMEPFNKFPKHIDQTALAELKERALIVVKEQVIPAYSEYQKFYEEQLAPACRETVGISAVEGGDAYYAHLVKFYTTTDQTPDEVHKTGLAEVARIKAEMLEVIEEAEFEGDFQEWLKYLRDTPEFYPKTAEERMQVAATISKKMDGELPKLFGKLPRMPYGLKEIPSDIAEKTTTAYYQRPAGDGSRAGFYFVNTSLLDTRPLYQLEALSLHEAVPGHHLQLALAQELDLPNFRKYGGQTVFVEGWALYSERLGLEVGFYQTPYTNFGRLSYEMWRACRLVVDTGIHSKGWTRQQAIDYMQENSGLSMNNITSEVDRYITWPGQALAYKTGELKIRELRALAEKKLGSDFDVRAFHDKVLENGAVPLSILEQIVTEWIEPQT